MTYKVDKQGGIRGRPITKLAGAALHGAHDLIDRGLCRGANARTASHEIVLPTDDDAWYFDPAGALFRLTHHEPVMVLDIAGRVLAHVTGGRIDHLPWPHVHRWTDTATQSDIKEALHVARSHTDKGRGKGTGSVVDLAFEAHKDHIASIVEVRSEEAA